MSPKHSSKKGYGTPCINKPHITKKEIETILKKKWTIISSLDIYKLYQRKWTTEKLADHFKKTTLEILNRLRSNEST